ncbi:MAG: c-type cytochrome [Proteobacteria bacterium]|nr:c-type cytochrome [Pseudomonadota bacterium]
MKRLVLAALAVALLAAAGTDDVQGERTAGEATVFAIGRNAFSFPLATLDDDEAARFAVGNSFFRRNWVEAPASTRARDGLGPHFLARACAGCHVQDGRGDPSQGLLLRLSIPGRGDHGGVVPEPTYGDQLNTLAIAGVKPEGQVVISHTPVTGRFADGTPYTLQAPRYAITGLGYGPLHPKTLVGPRVAPQLAGVGLIEAIPEAELRANAAAQAAMAGPIKGRLALVWDPVAQGERVGRFGWKANVGSLAAQTAGAFVGDIGITSPHHPAEACMPAQRDCVAAPSGSGGGAPEIDARTLADVVFYQATLAPAARRNVEAPAVQAGARLFAQAQCAVCHRPSYVTGTSPFPALSTPKVAGVRIWPYTDGLLHDMGPALADGRPDNAASGSQWKTPPLWGVGLVHDVNGHRRLLHDGRANGVLEAILWHGGEAEGARQQVLRLSRTEREALVAFVESL